MTEFEHKEAVPPAETASDAPEVDEKHNEEEDAGNSYEYEDFDMPTTTVGTTSTRTVQRRNVMKADEAIYNVSYHPGRVVSE